MLCETKNTSTSKVHPSFLREKFTVLHFPRCRNRTDRVADHGRGETGNRAVWHRCSRIQRAPSIGDSRSGQHCPSSYYGRVDRPCPTTASRRSVPADDSGTLLLQRTQEFQRVGDFLSGHVAQQEFGHQGSPLR